MKKIIFALIIMAITTCVFANDTVTYDTAGNIYPVKNTKISIEDELLFIKYRERSRDWEVNVYFKFYNPSDTVVLPLAFVSKSFSAPQEYQEEILKDFKIYSENEMLTVKNTKVQYDDDGSNDYMYVLFDFKFKKGMNYINHRYIANGGWIIGGDGLLQYVLMSGNNWAGPIKHIKIIADCGPYSSISINMKGITVLGSGKVIGEDFEGGAGYFIREGVLVFDKKDFVPEKDLEIMRFADADEINNKSSKIHRPEEWEKMEDPDYEAGMWKRSAYTIYEMQNKDISTLEYEKPLLDGHYAQLLINSLYAYRGYYFDSEEQRAFFDKFNWYAPDRAHDITFSDTEQRNIDYLKGFIK